MSRQNAALIAAILLTALVVVGLILMRPMRPERYADGSFDFDAVDQIYISAGTFEYGSTAPVLLLTGDDPEFEDLVDLFDGRGFGRTLGSLFSGGEPVYRVGDRYWTVSFRCTLTGSSLSAEYAGGTLRLFGGEAVTVSAQNKEAWAQEIYDLILSLYPEPEEPEDGETPENPADTGDQPEDQTSGSQDS